MKKSLTEALYTTSKESAKNNALKHSKKVRTLINEIMNNEGCNHLDITVYNAQSTLNEILQLIITT